MYKCMECKHGIVCGDFEGEHAKDCEFFLPENPWISVKERLPAELAEVLAYTDLGEQRVSMAFLENGKWHDGYSGCGIVLMQQELVTHWMPLPEPPEEGNHDA